MRILRPAAIVMTALFAIVFSSPALAAPPTAPGFTAATWYNGVWSLTIKETCFAHTDGKRVLFPVEQLFMTMTLNGLTNVFDAQIFADVGLTVPIGTAVFDFDFPDPAVVTFLVDGDGDKIVQIPGIFAGVCGFTFMGTLKTAVQKATPNMTPAQLQRLQRLSIITGWNMAECDPDVEGLTAFKCRSNWRARWVRPLTIQ